MDEGYYKAKPGDETKEALESFIDGGLLGRFYDEGQLSKRRKGPYRSVYNEKKFRANDLALRWDE